MNATFSDSDWRNAVLRLLAALNAAEHSHLTQAKTRLDEKELITIASDLAAGKYRPQQWFQDGKELETGPLRTSIPPLNPQVEYLLLKLNALDQPVTRVSMRFGGIAFEDPFYAVLACYNAAQYGSLFFVPRVTSVEHAWKQRGSIMDAVRNGSYRPEKFFLKCTPMTHSENGLPVEELSVRGALLEQLRESGRGNVPDPKGISKYALYEFVPEL